MKSIVLAAVACVLSANLGSAGDCPQVQAQAVQKRVVVAQAACPGGYCPLNGVDPIPVVPQAAQKRVVVVQEVQPVVVQKRVVVQDVQTYSYGAAVQNVQVKNVQVKSAHSAAAANVKVQSTGGGNIKVNVNDGRQSLFDRLRNR